MLLLGGVMFPDRSGAEMHLMYGLLLKDWARAGGYACGAAVLAYLYRELGRTTLRMTSAPTMGGDLRGWTDLIAAWVRERFPALTPLDTRNCQPVTEDSHPRAARWLPHLH
ncbi:unnamed protein product [Linum trigynum]|uniref:Aminotransferase-like plant mobile domain-containing protein n=1 Tax=Linum trigynum TaxID=586398 RepID=A0AAV2GDS8_9ROSI